MGRIIQGTKCVLSRLKDILLGYAKGFWILNWEAKLGLCLLTPPLIGTFFFLMTLLGINNSFFKDGSYDVGIRLDIKKNYLNPKVSGEINALPTGTMPSVPIYLGLMAIAGAYLIKGNLKSDKR